METWEWECFEEVVNDILYKITSSGPLLNSINKFTIKRDRQLQLTMQTISPFAEKSLNDTNPPGTISKSTDKVNFDCIGNIGSAVAEGVICRSQNNIYRVNQSESYTEQNSTLHSLSIDFGSSHKKAKYQIEWLENVDDSVFHWPDSVNETDLITKERKYVSDDDFVIKTVKKTYGGSRNCVYCKLDSYEFYLGTVKRKTDLGVKPGYILYKTILPEQDRRKIRDCLSFVFGRPFLYIGHTIFTKTWSMVSTYAVSPNTIHGQVFQLHSTPPAPLDYKYQNFIDASIFSHIVNSLIVHYEQLKLRNLIWAYWYARCAPLHMAAAHYGAIHEKLQRTITENVKSKIFKGVVPKPVWDSIRKEMLQVLSTKNLELQSNHIFSNKINQLNELPQKLLNNRFLTELGILLSDLEMQAWNQRNNAAHGLEFEEEDVVDIIRETKILQTLLHRIILKTTNASNTYYDYYSLDYPIRGINTSIGS